VWSFRDVTERKQVEEKLKESEKKYRDLFNNDLAGNFITTADGKIQLCNPAFVNIFGFNSIEDALQFNANRFYKNSQERKQLIKTLQEKKKLEFVEKELIRQDGKVITVLLNEIGEFDEKDKLVRMIGYLLDISERKEKQEEINQLNEELEQRVTERTAQLQAINKELESFSYSVSHDLRAPLRAIDGFTRILFEEYEPKLDEEGKRLCEMIRENTLRMGKLIDDLLSFSRLSRIDLNISRIDMQKLANSAYDEITLPEQRQRIDFHLGEIAAVHGDRTLLQQVWINLISNAIKFSSRREHALIRISSKLEKKRVVYSIMDNGAGFDMKYVDKLFGVFQRLHSVKDFEGTGVGLAIVQHIIIRHGGQVWAEGEVDNGATFYFSLPLEARGKRQ
jgi:PAS domain S-box-containing protein